MFSLRSAAAERAATPVAKAAALANVEASVGTPYDVVGNAPAVTIAQAAGITRYGRCARKASSSHCRPMDMPQPAQFVLPARSSAAVSGCSRVALVIPPPPATT